MENTKKEKPEKRKKGSTDKKVDTVKLRFAIITGIFVLLFLAAFVKIITINAFDGDKYTQAALSQVETGSTTITAKRGDIVDCNNVTLATSTLVYDMILDPKLILEDADTYLEPTLSALEEYFDFSDEELRSKIYNNPDSHYVVIAKELTYSQTEDFLNAKSEDSNIVGVWMVENYKRNYTFDTLASSVLGFTNSEGAGIYGLEYQYDDELTGTDGKEYSYVNSDNVLESVRKEAEDGYTLKLTIDYNIQSIVESKIKSFLEEVEADTVAVIIQDPTTGEILAMADSNNFDCNNPRDLSLHYTEEEINAMSDEETTNALSEMWKNFCITGNYEPGSTFKPFTMAMALENDKVTLDDTYFCGGSLQVLDATVGCHEDTGGHGTLTAKEAIAQSCNVALMQIGQSVGAEDFVKYQKNFGFGRYTGIDLPNELSCSGLLYDETMSELDLSTNSFGQNFNVTMIQLSTAFCSLINGGYYYQPYVVKGIYNEDGELVKSTDATLVSRTISEDTSDKLKQCMRAVVTEGTGTAAAVDNYVVSGKTGTAEKSGREEGSYLISFIGFAPYENPEVVCYVVIDEPSTQDQAGVSGQLFKSIMEEVLPYMNVATASMDTDPENVSNGTVIYEGPEETEESETSEETTEAAVN